MSRLPQLFLLEIANTLGVFVEVLVWKEDFHQEKLE